MFCLGCWRQAFIGADQGTKRQKGNGMTQCSPQRKGRLRIVYNFDEKRENGHHTRVTRDSKDTRYACIGELCPLSLARARACILLACFSLAEIRD